MPIKLSKPAPVHIVRAIALILILTVMLVMVSVHSSSGPAAHAATVTVGANANDYPRIIRLAHNGSANGTLMVISDGFVPYKSSDNGLSWSALPAPPAGSGICCPGLFELPTALGNLPAGTILLARTEGSGGSIELYASTNQGNNWSHRSTIATNGQGNGLGLWEPEFAVDSAGNLVVYYSDERHQNDGYNQLLAHEVSTDGGQTWGPEVYDVALNDNNARPGMARVVKLPTGTYVMAYEVCGNPGCSVHIRTSADADNWGSATDLGTQVYAGDNSYFVSSPGLAWSQAGGGNGELILVGKYLQNAANGHQSGNTLFITTDLSGKGGWTAQPAPLSINVPGGGDHCANYSTSLLPSADGTSLLEAAGSYASNGQCQMLVGSSNGTEATGAIGAPGNKCVDVANGDATSGTHVQLYDCNGSSAQLWTVANDHTLRALGKCLDIDGNGTANETKVELWDCNGVGGQQWIQQSNGSLYNPQSGRCLDDPAGNTTNGTQLQIWDCNNQWPQVYHLPG
ncbi:sugar-binding protein [Dictyobacter alpinus]|uniref:Sugar-binding protein n=1 Tax=Dictyobacter alpinus TaxID=2014873 RepID=A0A402BB99_9CHLR|nr:sialidase family protein [Dictyobacter alpinus]GCE28572.1 sugar-binding protein [Dictyobacter alpinus]